jgi:hypothetical protein
MNEDTRRVFEDEIAAAPGWHAAFSRPATFTAIYPWYILVAAMDVMLTWLILMLGGRELNGIAVLALDRAGLHGLIGLKFATVLTVIAICEFIAMKSPATARRLAAAAVAISTFPVVVGILEIARSPLAMLP